MNLPKGDLEYRWSDGDGKVRPYSMSRYVDGSILEDIPQSELRTLFNVKNFMVSQVNPHFTPFVSSHTTQQHHGGRTEHTFLALLAEVLEQLWRYTALDLRNRYARILLLALLPKIRGTDVSPFLMQSAEGNITLLPASPEDFWRITTHPEPASVKKYIELGAKKTWASLLRIKHSTLVS